MLVDRAPAQPQVVELLEPSLDLVSCDRMQLLAAELPQDASVPAAPALLARRCAGRGEQVVVDGQRRWLVPGDMLLVVAPVGGSGLECTARATAQRHALLLVRDDRRYRRGPELFARRGSLPPSGPGERASCPRSCRIVDRVRRAIRPCCAAMQPPLLPARRSDRGRRAVPSTPASRSRRRAAGGLHQDGQAAAVPVCAEGWLPCAGRVVVVVCKWPFRGVSSDRFGHLLRNLATHDLIVQDHDGTIVIGLAGERLVNHYDFYAAFTSPEEYRLVGPTGGRLGRCRS